MSRATAMPESSVNESWSGFRYSHSQLNESHRYLLPAVQRILREYSIDRGKRVFDLGCGNGAVANALSLYGFDVTGVDASEEGIFQARQAYPNLRLAQGSAYDDLAAQYGRYPVVISLEVIEHLYFPRSFVETLWNLLESNGIAIVSTPYHGYLKNLAIALSGNGDRHYNPLADHGHIKFFSKKTLRKIFEERGFLLERLFTVGRVPLLAKSMIGVFRRAG